MKATLVFCCCLVLAGTFTEVQCKRKRPRTASPSPRSSPRPLLTGWRLGKGPCICDGNNRPTKHYPTGHNIHYPTGHHTGYPTGHQSHYPTGHHSPHHTGNHSPHPTWHHTGHHSPPHTGHHSPPHTGHHSPPHTGHHSPPHTGHHSPPHTGHHSPPHTGHHSPPHTGHHSPPHTGHHSPHHTGNHSPHPTKHHGPHPTGHHGPHPTGHHTGQPTGHHSAHPWHSLPTRGGGYKRCVCRKRPEKVVNIKFRMNKPYDIKLSDTKSMAYKKLSMSIMPKIKKVLKMLKKFLEMAFTKGSIVVQFGVVYDVAENGSIPEDPEKALRNSIQNGEMKGMGIYPDSLAVKQTYSGIQLSEWNSSDHDCKKGCSHSSKMVQETRTCTEIDSSCDGISLTRETTCQQACPIHHAALAGYRKASKTLLIVGLLIGVVVIIAAVVFVVKFKKSSHKYLSTSPSMVSIKELTKNDELQLSGKC